MLMSENRSLILTAGVDYSHVYMSKKTAGSKNTVKYLGRYLKEPPIAGSRLAHYAGGATLRASATKGPLGKRKISYVKPVF